MQVTSPPARVSRAGGDARYGGGPGRLNPQLGAARPHSSPFLLRPEHRTAAGREGAQRSAAHDAARDPGSADAHGHGDHSGRVARTARDATADRDRLSERRGAREAGAAKSLVRRGFRCFLILNAHSSNRAIPTFIVDRINQETGGMAVDLGAVARGRPSASLYLIPGLVDLDAAYAAEVTLRTHRPLSSGLRPDDPLPWVTRFGAGQARLRGTGRVTALLAHNAVAVAVPHERIGWVVAGHRGDLVPPRFGARGHPVPVVVPEPQSVSRTGLGRARASIRRRRALPTVIGLLPEPQPSPDSHGVLCCTERALTPRAFDAQAEP